MLVAALLSAASISSVAAQTSTTTSTSTEATGTPLKLGMVTPLKSTLDFSGSVAAARAAAARINKAGGVNGHPIEIEACNTQLQGAQETACVRKIIDEKVIATVGNQLVFSDAVSVPLLRDAHIANLAPGLGISGAANKDPNSFIIGGTTGQSDTATLVTAAKYGGKKLSLVYPDIPGAAQRFAFGKQACKELKCTVVSQAQPPLGGVADYAPYASQAIAGDPDIVVASMGPSAAPFLTALYQLGFTGKAVAPDNNISRATFFGLSPNLIDNYVTLTTFPPAFESKEYPAVKQFVKDMKAAKAAGDADAPDYTDYSDRTVWDGYYGVLAFADVATKAKAYTPEAFQAAMMAADAVDLGVVVWNPNKVDGVDPLVPRLTIDQWFPYTFNGGKPKVLGGGKPIRAIALSSKICNALAQSDKPAVCTAQ